MAFCFMENYQIVSFAQNKKNDRVSSDFYEPDIILVRKFQDQLVDWNSSETFPKFH